MSGMFLAAWICLAICCPLTTGQVETTTATVSNAGGTVLQELREMKQVLNSIHQALMSPCRAVRVGSCLGNKLQDLEERLAFTEAKLSELETMRGQERAGSSFVRWGRKSCTANSQLVYSGVAGGSNYLDTGAAVNVLCLTMTPKFDNTPLLPYVSLLFGTEYEWIPGHHDHDVPCSVCRAAQSTTIMIPATQDCPSGWTTQYTGHLAAGYYGHKAASEYVCLDSDLENASGGERNDNGKVLYYTVTRCGSLPCPPYVNNTVVLCAVCSK